MHIMDMKILIIFSIISFDNGLAMSDVVVELSAPRFVVHHHSATLRCDHNVDPQYLYKVVFFKDGLRIMQFVHGRDPPFELFNIPGFDTKLSNLTSTSIALEAMDFSAAGSYACEIALETPLYSKLSKQHEITIIVRQKHRPKIKIKRRKFLARETLEATCQSAPAHPTPHLAWFIDNHRVDETFTTPVGVTVHKFLDGMPLTASNSSLHYPLARLDLRRRAAVDVGCVATIPTVAGGGGFADLQNATLAVNVIRLEPPPTQMPVKILSSDLNAATRQHSPIQVSTVALSLALGRRLF